MRAATEKNNSNIKVWMYLVCEEKKSKDFVKERAKVKEKRKIKAGEEGYDESGVWKRRRWQEEEYAIAGKCEGIWCRGSQHTAQAALTEVVPVPANEANIGFDACNLRAVRLPDALAKMDCLRTLPRLIVILAPGTYMY